MAAKAEQHLEIIRANRIDDTILWCMNTDVDEKSRLYLRSNEFQPVCTGSDRYGLRDQGKQVVDELAMKRSRLVQAYRPFPHPLSSLKHEGRLLAYQPDAGFMDGIAEDASEGFFDQWDAPPWDTWILYFHQGHISHIPPGAIQAGVLISWVPPSRLKLAQAGINDHAMGALKWLDEVDVRLKEASA